MSMMQDAQKTRNWPVRVSIPTPKSRSLPEPPFSSPTSNFVPSPLMGGRRPSTSSPSPLSLGPRRLSSDGKEGICPPRRLSEGGTYKPSHDRGRKSLSREDLHELGKNYLQGRRSSWPTAEARSPQRPAANPVLHHLRNWTDKSPADSAPESAALHLRGPHSQSLNSLNRLAKPLSMTSHRRLSLPNPLPADSVTGEELRNSIDAAFDMVDTDGNGTIDRSELKQIMSVMCGNLDMELTEDSVDAIFGEIDTDNSGDISPLEFRVFLERTLVEAEARGRQLDLQTLVSTSFHDALVRAKRDHNIVVGTFLKASKVFMCDETGAAQVGQSSRVFDIFRRLMGCPLDPSLLDTGDRGRAAFIIKALREVLGLADVVLAPPMPNEPAQGKARERGARLIRDALFGRGDQGEDRVSAVCIFRFAQEWLDRIDDWELESAQMGQMMGQLGSRWMSVKRDILAKGLPERQETRWASAPPARPPPSAKILSPLSLKPVGPPASRAPSSPEEILARPNRCGSFQGRQELRIPRKARRRSLANLEGLDNMLHDSVG